MQVVFQIRRWGLPLEDGGLLDQPASLYERMAVVEDAYNAVDAFSNIPAGAGAKWVERNPRAWRLVQEIMFKDGD